MAVGNIPIHFDQTGGTSSFTYSFGSCKAKNNKLEFIHTDTWLSVSKDDTLINLTAGANDDPDRETDVEIYLNNNHCGDFIVTQDGINCSCNVETFNAEGVAVFNKDAHPNAVLGSYTASTDCITNVEVINSSAMPEWLTNVNINTNDKTITGNILANTSSEARETVTINLRGTLKPSGTCDRSITVNQDGTSCSCNNLNVPSVIESIPSSGMEVGEELGVYEIKNECEETKYTSKLTEGDNEYEVELSGGKIILTKKPIPPISNADEGKTFTLHFYYNDEECEELAVEIPQLFITCSCESINYFIKNGTFAYFPLNGTGHEEQGTMVYEYAIVGSGTTGVFSRGKAIRACGKLRAQSDADVFVNIPVEEQTRVSADTNNRVVTEEIPLTEEEIEAGLKGPYKFIFKAKVQAGEEEKDGSIDIYFNAYDSEEEEFDKCEGAYLHVARTSDACDCSRKPSYEIPIWKTEDFRRREIVCGGFGQDGNRHLIGTMRNLETNPKYMTYKAELITDFDYIYIERYLNREYYKVIYTDEGSIIEYNNQEVELTIVDGIAKFTLPYEQEERQSPIRHVDEGIEDFAYGMRSDGDRHALDTYGTMPYRNESGEARVVGIVKYDYICGNGISGAIETYCSSDTCMYIQEACELCNCDFLKDNFAWEYNEEDDVYVYEGTKYWCQDIYDSTLLYHVQNNDCLVISDVVSDPDVYTVNTEYEKNNDDTYNCYLFIANKEGVEKDNREATIEFKVGYKDENDDFVDCFNARLNLTEEKCDCDSFDTDVIDISDIEFVLKCNSCSEKIFSTEELCTYNDIYNETCIKFYIEGPGEDTSKHTGYDDKYYYKKDGKTYFTALVDQRNNNHDWYVQVCSYGNPKWSDIPEIFTDGIDLTIGAYIGEPNVVGEICTETPTIKVNVKKEDCDECTCEDFITGMTKGDNVTWGETIGDVTEVYFVHNNSQKENCIDVNVVSMRAGCGGYIKLEITDENGNIVPKPDYVCSTSWARKPSLSMKKYRNEEEPRITYFIAQSYDSTLTNCFRRFKLIETYEFSCDYVKCDDIDTSFIINPQLENVDGYYVIKQSEWSSGEIPQFITFTDQPCVSVEAIPEDTTHLSMTKTIEDNKVKFDLTWDWSLDKEHYIIDYWIKINRSNTSDETCVNGTGEFGIKLTFIKNA